MRSNRSYSAREHFSAIRKLLVTKLSLIYLKLIPKTKLFLVRDGGLGDAIMATSIVEELKSKYPAAKFYLSTNFPELFKAIDTKHHSFFSFPIIWLSYTHYDFFPWTMKAPLHCGAIMAKLAGIKGNLSLRPRLAINDKSYEEFTSRLNKEEGYVVIQPFAGEWFRTKNWYIEYWEDLIQRLKSEGEKVYQIGTLDNPLIRGALDFRGMATLDQTFLLIKNAAVLIGVNSFAEQAAYAFDVPSIVLYGPTNPIYSLNPRQVAVTSDRVLTYEELSHSNYSFSEMNTISSATVLRALEQIKK